MTSVAQRTCDDLSRKINEALDPETLATLRTPGRGGVALAAALKMLGVPYSWGGGGPDGPSYGIGRGASTKGFDCSGLAEYAWAKAGVKIGGHTSTQSQAGVHVPRTQLKPGDLLFFAKDPKNPATIHHVVINIDGKRYLPACAIDAADAERPQDRFQDGVVVLVDILAGNADQLRHPQRAQTSHDVVELAAKGFLFCSRCEAESLRRSLCAGCQLLRGPHGPRLAVDADSDPQVIFCGKKCRLFEVDAADAMEITAGHAVETHAPVITP